MRQKLTPPSGIQVIAWDISPVDDTYVIEDVCMMNNGDRPLHAAESAEAERVLDDPDSIQQKMDLSTIRTTKPIRHMNRGPGTKLGIMLLAERAKKGWSYTEAAKTIGLDRREVAKIEQGTPPVPHIDKVKKFIDAYSMDTKTVLRVYSRMKSLYGDKKPSTTVSKNARETKKTTDLVEEVLSLGSPAGASIPTEKKELTEGDRELDSLISIMTEDAQTAAATTPEIVLEMQTGKLIEALTDKIRGMNTYDLCKVAIQAGIPVHISSEGTFRIALRAQCPLCHSAINSNDIVVSKEIPGMMSNRCNACNTTFQIPYEAMLSASARIEKRTLLNEKNPV